MSIMRLVTAACDLSDPVLGRPPIPAGTPVVMPAYAAVLVSRSLREAGVATPRVSTMGYYLRQASHTVGREVREQTLGRLLAWRGAGIGDQLIVAGCLQEIARLCPGAELGLMCDPNVAKALYGGASNLPFEVMPEPLTFADWSGWDWHWVVEGYCDGCHEPLQPDALDGHFCALGLDPQVPPERRRAFVPRSPRWDERAAEYLHNVRDMVGRCDQAGLERPVILWQLAASTPMRSLAPEHTVGCLQALMAALPEALVILAGHPLDLEAYAEAQMVPGVAATTAGLALQEVFALAALADVVVCPDSCLGHVAAALDRPCVCYWCAFPSTARAANYHRHRNLAPAVPPPCAPCWAHEYGPMNMQRGCPLTETDRTAVKWCKGLAAIRPETIVDAVVATLNEENG